MKKLITAQEFERAFRSQWEEERDSREEDIKALSSNWNNNKAWTKFMLKGNKAFLYKVLQNLEKKDIDFSREKGNKFDGIYHRRESFYRGYYYPPCMDVLIEHENDEYIEEEMWKLLMWRSPLKVLVCYDWAEDEKTTCKRTQWLKNKLDELADMARQVNETWKEAEDTEYLIVIGNLNVDNIVIWEFKKLDKDYKWVNNS